MRIAAALIALLLCTPASAQTPPPVDTPPNKPADTPPTAPPEPRPADAPPVAAGKSEAPPAAAKDAPAAAEVKADCGREALDKQLDDAMSAIKASPAFGHASGHLKAAIKQLEAAKKNVDRGCAAYEKPAKIGKGKAR